MNNQEFEYWKLRQQVRAQKDKRRKRESYARKKGWGLGFEEEDWFNAPTMAQFRKMSPEKRKQTIQDWEEIINDRNEQFEGRLASITKVKSEFARDHRTTIDEVDKVPDVLKRKWLQSMQSNILGFLKHLKVNDLMDFIDAMDADPTFKEDFKRFIRHKLERDKEDNTNYDSYYIKTSPEQIINNIDYYKTEFLQFTNTIGANNYEIIDGKITLVNNTMG